MNLRSRVRIAAVQCNPVVGDFDGNLAQLVAAARSAVQAGADVLLTPELAMAGYPPEDLLLRPSFYRAAEAAFERLRQASLQWPGLMLVVGQAVERQGKRRNAATLVQAGVVIGEYWKRELPNYDVFDEERYFAAGDQALVVHVAGVAFGVLICEDFWKATVPAQTRAAGAQVILALNASPYHTEKQPLRLETARDYVCALGCPIVAANMVGGQDELVFDGGSFALDAAGVLCAQSPQFIQDVLLVDLAIHATAGSVPPPDTAPSNGPHPAVPLVGGVAPRIQEELFGSATLTVSGPIEPPLEADEQIYSALVLGVRDYVQKNGFPGALLGLSGGVDSALTLAIAVDALGAERVRCVMMPSRYTADISWIDAREMASRLGVRYDEIPIAGPFDAFHALLAAELEGRVASDTTEENLQARIRGTLLMALSNRHGAIVLTTGNKSEMATGYCTLYGDMAGGFAVLKDLLKTTVWRLCRWRNRATPSLVVNAIGGEVIPMRIIERAPSAELRADQTDQDSLPPYEVLDAILTLYMEQGLPAEDVVAAGFPVEAVALVTRLLRINEYKRRQAPVGVRVTHRGFGRDWRYPITSRFRESI
jgi:NAD+ synthase (glutamine-hydrolysing)